MAKQRTAPANRKKIEMIALAGLGAVLLYFVVNNVFLSTPSPRPSLSGTAARTTNSGRTLPISTPQKADIASQRLAAPEQAVAVADVTPLDLTLISDEPIATKVGLRGNIFGYYIPPPPLPKKADPPPPITLRFVQPQTAVAGTPRAFTVTVQGENFPPDAQVLFDGSPRPGKRVDDKTLTVEVGPADYTVQRNINVEVKSQSNPSGLYSNSIPLLIQATPEPPFKYIGRIGDQGLFEMLGTKEVSRLRKGATLAGVWRIDSISDAGVDLTHTQYDIKRRIPMQEKTR